MKKNLIVVSLVLLALAVLCSCMIDIDPYDPQPVKEKFTFSSVFSGPVTDYKGDTSYQFMCYVENNTGAAVENLELEIEWKDSDGKPVLSEKVTVPRLEARAKWPVGVFHGKEYEQMLEGTTASIKYGEFASDLSRYSTNIIVTGGIHHPESGGSSYAHGSARHNNSYDILDPVVYVVSESGGKIIEYGMRSYNNTLASGLSTLIFDVTLNPPAKNPENSTTYYFVVGTRRPF